MVRGDGFGLTVMVRVTAFVHCPAVGVKVYVVVAVLFNEGDHVPLMPLSDVVGKGDKAAPEQIGATAAKTGVAPPPMEPTVFEMFAVQPFWSFTIMA